MQLDFSYNSLGVEHSYCQDNRVLHSSVFNTEWMKEPQIVFDVGAWDFGDSIRFALAYPNAKIYGFELLKSNYDKHSEYAQRFGVKTFNLAISDRNEEIEFYEGSHIDGDNAQSSILSPTDEYVKRYGSIVKHVKSENKVQSRTIEAFCIENNIPKIDLLHIDVEGAEYNVFSGFGKFKPKLIFAEFLIDGGWTGQKSFKDTLELLTSLNYREVKNTGHDKLFLLNSEE